MTDDQSMLCEAGQCKICHRQLVLQVHTDCPSLQIAIWRGMVCCDHCHQYWARLQRLRGAARQSAMELHTARQRFQFRPHELDQIAGSVRTALAQITRKIADHVCRKWGVATRWEPDFVEQIMENPTKSDFVITRYENMVRE